MFFPVRRSTSGRFIPFFPTWGQPSLCATYPRSYDDCGPLSSKQASSGSCHCLTMPTPDIFAAENADNLFVLLKRCKGTLSSLYNLTTAERKHAKSLFILQLSSNRPLKAPSWETALFRSIYIPICRSTRLSLYISLSSHSKDAP